MPESGYWQPVTPASFCACICLFLIFSSVKTYISFFGFSHLRAGVQKREKYDSLFQNREKRENVKNIYPVAVQKKP